MKPDTGYANETLNHLIFAVRRLTVAGKRRRLQALIGGLDLFVDQLVLLLEQAVTLEVALDDQRAEILHIEHPHRLGDAELFQPVHIDDPLNRPAQQRAGAEEQEEEAQERTAAASTPAETEAVDLTMSLDHDFESIPEGSEEREQFCRDFQSWLGSGIIIFQLPNRASFHKAKKLCFPYVFDRNREKALFSLCFRA